MDVERAQNSVSSIGDVPAAWHKAVSRLSRVPQIGPDLESGVRTILQHAESYVDQGTVEAGQDAYEAAYAIAHKALEDMGQRMVIAVFRDALAEALAPALRSRPSASSRLLRFFSIISDAYWQAYADNLKRTIRNQAAENISKELRLAKYIQQYLLPKVIPQIDGYQFAGKLVPAAEVGGDYWSVKHYQEDGIVTFKLADIAGHGIASATLVAAVKFISGGYYQGAKTAASVMQKTNHVLVKETPSDILVTMVYGWLYPESGDVNIVNAGHSPVFIVRKGRFVDIEPTGPVLGLTEGRYGERRLHLDPGDIVFTCSDGITEARKGREIFGVERVKEIVRANQHLDAGALIDAVMAAAQEFSGGPTDDMSAVVIKVLDNADINRWHTFLPGDD